MNEEALLLGARGSLVGVHTLATTSSGGAKTAAIFINGGLISHIGPHRLYVRMARALSELGLGCLRFDISGIGDSSPRRDGMSMPEVFMSEPCEIMDDLEKLGYRQFILIGVCSGAYVAYKVAGVDERVIGALMINPINVEGDESWDAEVQSSYYMNRSMKDPRAWLNLLTGRVDYRRLVTTMMGQLKNRLGRKKQAVNASVEKMRQEITQLTQRNVRIFYLLSEYDVSVAYTAMVVGTEDAPVLVDDGIRVTVIPKTDHLFTRLSDQTAAIKEAVDWCRETLRTRCEKR